MTFIPSQTTLNNVDGKDIEVVNYSVTGLGAGTVPQYVDVRTFREFSFEYAESGTGTTTLKVYASNDDVAQGSATYVDISATLFSAASFTGATTIFEMSKIRMLARWLKFEMVTDTGADNVVDLVVRAGW